MKTKIIHNKLYIFRYNVLFLLAFTCLSTVYAEELITINPDSTYKRANDAYFASDYSTAIDLYKKLIQEDFESAELYFNMGNAYYKQNYLPLAILYYEKAKRIKPNDEAINYNLQLVNTFKVDQIEELPEFFLKTFVKNFVLLMSFETWGYLSITFFALCIIFVLIYLFTSKIGFKKTSFILVIILFFFSIVSFTFAHQRFRFQISDSEAIITIQSVTLKGSPDESGTELFVLHEGTKVSIEDEIGDWYEIRISDGNKGWMKKSDLEII